jgi:NADPH-dependent 2,4-dienoyl-CoA reductase/sulfur reductase-like enzyme
MSVSRGAFVPLAAAIKEVVTVPVAANVRINDPLLAEAILREGKADLVAMGTPLVADPELPRKAREGRLDEIRPCVACCACWEQVIVGKPLACSVNPRVGRESEPPVAPGETSRKVVVVGGGPAGMEAAAVAAGEGHRVTLFEKEAELGGQLLYAAVPPYKEEWKTFVGYLRARLVRLGVDVRLGRECTVETIDEMKPDTVIVATGSAPVIPAIPGVEGDHVMTALDVLGGREPAGPSVVVLGGGSTGCETAEFLAEKGKHVTLLEMREAIGEDIGAWNRWLVIDRLRTVVRLETKARVDRITGKGVHVAWAGRYGEFFEADSVVIAAGMTAADVLTEELGTRVARLRAIGDCVRPGRVREAIAEGFQAGLEA